jgi:hypothetical protein
VASVAYRLAIAVAAGAAFSLAAKAKHIDVGGQAPAGSLESQAGYNAFFMRRVPSWPGSGSRRGRRDKR